MGGQYLAFKPKWNLKTKTAILIYDYVFTDVQTKVPASLTLIWRRLCSFKLLKENPSSVSLTTD